MAFSVEGNVYVATYAIYTDPADDEQVPRLGARPDGRARRGGGAGVYLGDTDFTRRQDRFLTDEHFAGCDAIRAAPRPGRAASRPT